MIEIGIHCNFFIDLPIRLRTCRSKGFFTRQNLRARKICPDLPFDLKFWST